MVSTGVSCLFYINIHVRQLVINKEINMTVIIYHPMSCPLLSISWNLSTHFAVVYSCFSCSFSRSRSQINNTLKKKSSFLVFLPARLAPFTQPPICCHLLHSQFNTNFHCASVSITYCRAMTEPQLDRCK